jgi:hypothetical protein
MIRRIDARISSIVGSWAVWSVMAQPWGATGALSFMDGRTAPYDLSSHQRRYESTTVFRLFG